MLNFKCQIKIKDLYVGTAHLSVGFGKIVLAKWPQGGSEPSESQVACPLEITEGPVLIPAYKSFYFTSILFFLFNPFKKFLILFKNFNFIFSTSGATPSYFVLVLGIQKHGQTPAYFMK